MRYSNRENKLQSLPCFEKELVGCLTTVLSLSNEKSRLGVIWTAEGRRRQTVCDKRDNNYVRKKNSPMITFLLTDLVVKELGPVSRKSL